MAKKGEIGAKNATKQEARDRMEMACTLLRRREPTGKAKQAMAKLYGISWRMANIYIARARKALLKESGRPETELRADAYALYVGMVEDRQLPPLTRLRAQELLVKLLGIEGAKRVDISGNIGVNDLRRELFHEAGYLAGERERAIQGDAKPSVPSSNGHGRAVENGKAPGGHR